MGQDLPALAIARLRAAWDKEAGPSVRRALAALAVATLFGGAHLARIGTLSARAITAGALAAVLLVLVARPFVLRRRRADPRRVVRDTVARMDPELGAATLRAITLVERTATDDRAGSPALANLHLGRLIARASIARLVDRAAASGRVWSMIGLTAACAAAGAVLFEPFRIVEGFDVLASRDGEAPLHLAWIDQVDLSAAPPDYLHQSTTEVMPFSHTAQPRGTTLTVRGRPIRAGRSLVLTDGKTDVPFLEDGSGGVVARWTLGDTTTLWIAASFGPVRVRQGDAQPVLSIPDQAPRVTVEGAPRTVKLLDEPSIPIHYEATDDHGLREVNLVLRSGAREERRVLSRPTADATVDRGGYEIRARDPFFKRTYAPVEVTVEARDNDVVAGPKWGKSPAILIVLPQVGEAEAMRYSALVAARDALIDLTAKRLAEKVAAHKAGGKPAAKPVRAEDPRAHVAREIAAQKEADDAVNAALAGQFGGLAVRGRVVSIARGQVRRLAKALDAEKKAMSAGNHQKLLDETEGALLAFDMGLRSLAYGDAQAVAKRLADVADEAAAALLAARTGAELAPAIARLDASIGVLDGGGKQMLKLGELGVDLGEIVANDLRRVARAREASDLLHAELAARDLAARLRRPLPSFGGGGRGGVESGGSGQSAGDAGEASAADKEAAEAEQELEELARDHAGEIGDVENALEKAFSPEELEALRAEAKKHADAIRQAVKHLPPPGGDPGSAAAAAASAREEAEAMAAALEGARPRDAVDNGKRAAQKLRDAKRLGEEGTGFFREERVGREAGAAQPIVERELAWAEEALQKLRRASSDRAKGDLKDSGKREQKLADRAKKLAQKGDGGDRSMPQEMLDRLGEAEQAMRDAEKMLGEGDGDNGLRLQRDAQRLLEMARGERERDEGEGHERGDGRKDDGKVPSRQKTEIPGKDAHKGPQEFRRRVLEGLGGSTDPLLREAVKRYAEGLLK